MPTEAPPAAEFLPFTVYSNWCYHDRLGERDLQTGDVVLIRWPDGAVVRYHVAVREWVNKTSRDWIAHRHAYISVEHRGVLFSARAVNIPGIVGRVVTPAP